MSRNVHEHKINISELRVIMNYIGIDLGTSAVKLLLMEGSGKILKIVSREYPICFPKPGGWIWKNIINFRKICRRHLSVTAILQLRI